MRRRLSVLLAFASATACQRRPELSPLDHDTTAARVTGMADTAETNGATASRVDGVLGDVRGALASGDTASAQDALASAVTLAGSNAELVAHVADQGLALGLAEAAVLGYRRYLAIAPNGPLAQQAQMKLALLATGDGAAPAPAAPAAANATKTAPRVAARVAARVAVRGRAHTAPRVPRTSRVTRVTQAPRAPGRFLPAVASAAPARSRRATVSGGDVAERDSVALADGVGSAVGDGLANATAAPTAVASPATPVPTPTRHPSTVRGAVVGAASGAVLGAVLGHGVRGAMAGAVAGGAMGAAVGHGIR